MFDYYYYYYYYYYYWEHPLLYMITINLLDTETCQLIRRTFRFDRVLVPLADPPTAVLWVQADTKDRFPDPP